MHEIPADVAHHHGERQCLSFLICKMCPVVSPVVSKQEVLVQFELSLS